MAETDILKKVPMPKSNGISDPCADKKVRCKTLIIHGGKYKTTFTKKFENRKKWTKPDENLLFSYIPGTIVDIKVQEGDVVRLGEPMLEFEAMKMLNTIAVPHDGVIKKIHVKVGDRIPKGFLMLEFE